jgi:hypothetical protein
MDSYERAAASVGGRRVLRAAGGGERGGGALGSPSARHRPGGAAALSWPSFAAPLPPLAMRGFRTPLERRLWLLAALLVLGIYASAYFVQLLLDGLRARGLLGPTIWACLALAAGGVLVALLRQRPERWELGLLLAASGAYALLLHHLDIIQERIHLLEYGALGGLCYGALRERWADAAAGAADARPGAPVGALRQWLRRWPGAVAVVLAGFAGWGDEIVQGILPNRRYDLRDVATNAEAAALLVAVLAARRRLRESRKA